MENNIPSKLKKSIFSDFKYRPTNEERKVSMKFGDFQSISSGKLDQKNDTKIINFGYKLQKKLSKLDDTMESGTQTSKTIIELAKIETESLSPDSLTQSPRKEKKNCSCPVNVPKDNLNQRYLNSSGNSSSSCSPRSYISYVNSQRNSQTASSNKNPLMFENSLTAQFLDKKFKQPVVNKKTVFTNSILPPSGQNLQLKSNSCIDSLHQTAGNVIDKQENNFDSLSLTSGSLGSFSTLLTHKLKNSFMMPTISSENKTVKNNDKLIVPSRRGRSASPYALKSFIFDKNIPYIDGSKTSIDIDESVQYNRDFKGKMYTEMPPLQPKNILNEEKLDSMSFRQLTNTPTEDSVRASKFSDCESYSCDNLITTPLAKLRSKDWNVSLQGLAEVVDFCRLADPDVIFPHMTSINQRLIELLRSPRSHVCRTACQAAGHLFEFVKDTRRPEFDEIVDLLLSRTADANKFIRQDANLALDCMVTHIGAVHAIRAICSKGPTHKNHLVRTAAIRLIVCVVVIAGPEYILSTNFGEQSRKKIITLLPKFIEDKNVDVRKFAERLYKILSHEHRFDQFLKKYVEKEEILLMKKNLRISSWKK